MFEIVFELSSLADTAVFYGINNSNMQLIKNLHPNLRIVARGNVIKIIGNQQEADKLIVNLQKLEKFSIDNNRLTETNIIELIKGENPKEISYQNLILHGVGGKSIFARTKNQQRLVDEFENNDLLFAIGPAGSGKTYTAIALAVRALKNKQIKKIILSRPAVEAGEKLGFLPGDMKEKIDPYLQPLYDALQDMITPLKLKEYMENGTIQIAPLAFMRGRTLSDAVVILDEAQNSTIMQIKMFLTRMGLNTKMIVTGDITQIDLPRDQKSGLIDALNLLGNIKGIARIDFDINDIVRHRLVQQIVQAYDNRAMNEKQKNTKKDE
ncbi:MAG TPA: PhoH family protein [Paludibacteraceae bacterium]|jgi:phosphate starvation-inducible PhoH-like protein|nr:PhoH family protein [Paludibacteraceae bacterium]MDS1031915.1 PhoH family protein [Porphyromonadaceae sp. NP-X]NMD00826.1 PhoH family protein [Bacteroidales bacterium]MBP9016401.1 PhoH family protein [Paludibacteraceae bacterium]HNZ62292.1 PhoH family protein [Paludibacteraceae bacterium]